MCRQRTIPNSLFNKKPSDEDTIRIENYRPISLMTTDRKFLTKYNFQQHIKKKHHEQVQFKEQNHVVISIDTDEVWQTSSIHN